MPEAFGGSILDSIVSVYLLGLGSFDLEGEGIAMNVGWALYLFATVTL